MSRLSTLGHELFERVFHRGDLSRSAVPESTDDTTATLRIVRDDIPQDLDHLDIEQLADADADDVRADDPGAPVASADGLQTGAAPVGPEPIDDDDRAFEVGQNWVESLEERAIEEGPAPEHEVRPPDGDRRH